MVKKIGLGIVAAIIVIGVTVYAADSRHFNGLQKDIRTVFKGILSPRQISTLMDFRRDHAEKFHRKADARPDLFKTWKELDLSEEQQGQLIKIAGDLVDKTHPYLMTMIETGAELKRKVLDVNVLCLNDGNPHHPAINQLSTRLGTQIGEISWNLALARSQVRSLLTPEQIEEPGMTEAGWSVKNLLWHLQCWAAEAARQLERIRMGTYEEKEWDTDALNQRYFVESQGLDLPTVRACLSAARNRGLQEWAALGEPTPAAIEWFEESGAIHFREHLPELQAWAERLTAGN